MRISVFSALSSFLLLLLTAAFAVALYVCAEQLSRNEQSSRQFQQQKAAINVGLYRTIQAYLQRGDAQLLTQAEEQIAAIQANLTGFDPALIATTHHALETLRQNLAGKYRASGKLSGNVQQLLQNAESDIAYYTKKLLQLAVESTEPAHRDPWLSALADSPQRLFELVKARRGYFGQPDETHWQQLDFQVTQWNALAGQLQTLPMPQLAAAEPDPYALIQVEPENPMQEALDELTSVINRYPKEIDNTRETVETNREMQMILAEEVHALEQGLEQIDRQLQQRGEQTRQQVEALLLIMVTLLVTYVIIAFLFQQRLVVARLRRLQRAFSELLQTDDIKPLEIADNRTELGQIATAFNGLLDNLQQEHAHKQRQMELVQHALTRMIEQVQQLTTGSQHTHQQITDSVQLLDDLQQLATEVSNSSNSIVQHAQHGEQHLSANQQDVISVREATQLTQSRVGECRSSLGALSQSVNDVSAIIDVISHIAEQTNLLALNAAIEAARAGDHGRGFAVVADEVRSLSTNTQKSLSEILTILDTLRDASKALQTAIEGIEHASLEQQARTDTMLQTSEQVRTATQHSAIIAQQGAGNAEEQVGRLNSFRQLMQQVTEQAQASRQLSGELAQQIQSEASTIRNTFADPA